jgi:hypothetical protein
MQKRHHGRSCSEGRHLVVRFRFLGKEYKRSTRSRERRNADAPRQAVEWTIHRLLSGQLSLPPNIDSGDFILSGGLLQKPLVAPIKVALPTTRQASRQNRESA